MCVYIYIYIERERERGFDQMGLNRRRQVYSHLRLFPNKARNIPVESQPVLDLCANHL